MTALAQSHSAGRTDRSPSGLFRMGTWEGEVERTHGQLPAWYWNAGERRRRFIRWVENEAEGLAMQLGRLLRSDTAPDTARPVAELIDALTRDAAWARLMEIQAFEEAA